MMLPQQFVLIDYFFIKFPPSSGSVVVVVSTLAWTQGHWWAPRIEWMKLAFPILFSFQPNGILFDMVVIVVLAAVSVGWPSTLYTRPIGRNLTRYFFNSSWARNWKIPLAKSLSWCKLSKTSSNLKWILQGITWTGNNFYLGRYLIFAILKCNVSIHA